MPRSPRVAELKTTAEVCAITGQRPRTIQIHAKRHGLGVIVGGSRLFAPKDIQALIALRRTPKEAVGD